MTGRFRLRLKDFDLGSPASKLAYNRDVFTVVAPRYDVITRLLSFGRDGRWKRMLVGRLPDSVSPRALDLACGTGGISRLLAARYPSGNIDAVDINPEMLRRARARTPATNVAYHTAGMQALPFPDQSYDIVTGGYALRNAPSLSQALREIYRVLKPGGIAAFLEFSASSRKPLRRLQYALLRFWGGLWGFLFHGNPEVYSYIAESLSLFPDAVELLALLRSHGFIHPRSRMLLGGFLALTVAQKPGPQKPAPDDTAPARPLAPRLSSGRTSPSTPEAG